jgi:hypothetical protein
MILKKTDFYPDLTLPLNRNHQLFLEPVSFYLGGSDIKLQDKPMWMATSQFPL